MFRIIQNHKVTSIFTVPTSFRVIKREDPNLHFGNKYSIASLEKIFVAGEHCDYETKSWVEKIFKVPVLNHWWQTETGHAITATCVGLGHSLYPPKYTAGMPFPGYNGEISRCTNFQNALARFLVKIMADNGTEAGNNELGRIVVKLPLPPGTMSTLYKNPEKFVDVYFKQYPVKSAYTYI